MLSARRIVDRLGVTWDERYGELKRYKERFGDCNVPAHSVGEYRQLGSWVNKNRTEQSNGTLSTDRKARLDELGFIWDAHESAWETMFAELKRCRLGRIYLTPSGPDLALPVMGVHVM